jgi:5-methylcytosine-specific restriction endonuclease McrA
MWQERIENFEQQLEVHHKNNNRNDMNPENLITFCSNAHGSYSAHENAGANRYDEKGQLISAK